MLISIIIPVYKGGADFAICIEALKILSPQPLEIIIVIDGCSDDSIDIAHTSRLSLFKIIKLNERSGAAKARNIGANAATGEILFFIDADVLVPSDIISDIQKIFTGNIGIDAVIGSYNDTPLKPNFLSQYKNLFHHYVHQNSSQQASTFWTGCGAIKRDVFTAAGGFNEQYKGSSIEDIELGYRLKSMGYNIRLEKSLQVTHMKEWRPISLIKSDLIDRAIPWTELSIRYKNNVNDLNLSYSSKISVVLVYLMILTFPINISVSSAFFIILISINLPIYRFYYQKRGLIFVLMTVPWHSLYYLYCGIGYVVGIIRYYYCLRQLVIPIRN